MSEIANISNFSDWRPTPTPFASQPSTVPLPRPESSDTVELTPFSKALLEASGGSSLRAARINAIRGEIKAGTFETLERVEGTVSCLIDVLG